MRGFLIFLSVLCWLFAIVDFAGAFLGYDITGVSWSPLVAAALGAIFAGAAGKK